MRVVSGRAGGRRLQAPPGRGTRPTLDRVREALFNALHSAGAVEGASVLDLFAGSGALGIEALSRGAATATFVDADPRALSTVRANLDATGLAGQATVVRADAVAFVVANRAWDLALLDPPYAFDGWAELGAVLDAGMVAAESDRPVELGARYEIVRVRRYGDTFVTLSRHDEGEVRG